LEIFVAHEFGEISLAQLSEHLSQFKTEQTRVGVSWSAVRFLRIILRLHPRFDLSRNVRTVGLFNSLKRNFPNDFTLASARNFIASRNPLKLAVSLMT
jgi:hypothetical protein